MDVLLGEQLIWLQYEMWCATQAAQGGDWRAREALRPVSAALRVRVRHGLTAAAGKRLSRSTTQQRSRFIIYFLSRNAFSLGRRLPRLIALGGNGPAATWNGGSPSLKGLRLIKARKALRASRGIAHQLRFEPHRARVYEFTRPLAHDTSPEGATKGLFPLGHQRRGRP